MPTLIAAEVASNHGGDLELAKEFVRTAAAAGVDFVKFQSWQASRLRDGSSDPQYDWFRRSELSDAAHMTLIEECNRNGVRFLTTVFDENRVDFLASLGLEAIKIASPDANNVELLKTVKKHFPHVIVSTGLSTEPEIRETAELLEGVDFTICHCVSVYPTPPESAHMDRVDWLRTLSSKIGYSDHSIGNELAKLAIAKRVHYLEKHFCLGREGPGRVCAWDATPDDMRMIAEFARLVEQVSHEPSAEALEQVEVARRFYVGRFARATNSLS